MTTTIAIANARHRRIVVSHATDERTPYQLEPVRHRHQIAHRPQPSGQRIERKHRAAEKIQRAGHRFADEIWTKIYLFFDMLTRQRADGALVASYVQDAMIRPVDRQRGTL